MIAVDTSSFVAYLQGDKGNDTNLVDEALTANHAVFPPVVVTELLSDPKLPRSIITLITQIPILEIDEGFWIRAGQLRSKVIGAKLKSRVADVLIAQACIDHQIALISRDRDFRHYQKHGLNLAK